MSGQKCAARHADLSRHIRRADLTSDGRPDQTGRLDANQQLSKQALPLKRAHFSQHSSPRSLILVGSKRRSSQATVMSAVIDLHPARCRPPDRGGVALATVAFWLLLCLAGLNLIGRDYYISLSEIAHFKYCLVERNWHRPKR